MKTPFYFIRRSQTDKQGNMIDPQYLHFADEDDDTFTSDVGNAKGIRGSVNTDSKLEACKRKGDKTKYRYERITINP